MKYFGNKRIFVSHHVADKGNFVNHANFHLLVFDGFTGFGGVKNLKITLSK